MTNTTETVAIEYLSSRYSYICWDDASRVELHREFHARLRRNLSSGRWAVAIVGSEQWMSSAAIGDGITSATAALLTRCKTKAEAEAIAAAANDLEPGLLPGQGFRWVYQALPYRRDDYIGSQNRQRGQRRDCDRRIAR